MKRVKQFSIWIIALLAMTVTNYAWAADTEDPKPGGYMVTGAGIYIIRFPVAISPTEIAVMWKPGTDNVTPQNKLRYRVLWKKSSADSWQVSHGEDNLQVNMTSYTITGLQPNTEYNVFVSVWDEAGNNAWYGVKTVRTKAPDTEKPTVGRITYVNFTATTIEAKWTKATDNVTPQNKLRYWISATTSHPSGGKAGDTKTDITSDMLTGLLPNTKYEVGVTVKDEAGNMNFYSKVTITTKAAPDTQDPTPGTLTVGTVTTNSIALSWTKGTDNITPQSKLRYNIMWKKLPDGVWEYSHESNYPVDITSYTITGLQPNTEYKVDVSVRDEANNSVFYGEKKVKTKQAADTQDPTPGSYGFIASTENSIALSWTRGYDNITPQNKLRYKVWWKKKSDSDWESSQYTVNMTSYTITGLDPDTEYEVDVRVIDEADNYDEYGEKTVKTKADTEAPVPGGSLTVVTVTTNSIALSWPKGTDNVTPQNKLRYRVLWQKSSSSTVLGEWKYSHPFDNPAVDMTSYTITGLEPNTEYRVHVIFADEANHWTRYDLVDNIKTKQATTPSVPVTGVTLNRNSVTIDGDYSTIQLTATVHPSNASDKSLTWASSDPTVVSVDSKGLVTIHKKGKARVTATANDGSGQSDTCLFDVIRTVANETVDGLRVYAHGSALYLTLPKAETIHIYNVGGSLVKTLALPAGDHVQPLAPGVYLVRVGEQVTKILVK